jgi:hypothetical protein
MPEGTRTSLFLVHAQIAQHLGQALGLFQMYVLAWEAGTLHFHDPILAAQREWIGSVVTPPHLPKQPRTFSFPPLLIKATSVR